MASSPTPEPARQMLSTRLSSDVSITSMTMLNSSYGNCTELRSSTRLSLIVDCSSDCIRHCSLDRTILRIASNTFAFALAFSPRADKSPLRESSVDFCL